MEERKMLLTNSRRNVYGDCQRKHYYRYELGYQSVRTAHALYFGRMIHEALEAWYLSDLGKALNYLDKIIVTEWNVYDIVTCIELIKGYDIKYRNQDLEVIGIEKEFRVPLVNPETNRASQNFDMAGKLDLLLANGILEHKSTTKDISEGSEYWANLFLDPQISQYVIGGESLNVNIETIIYDVIRKPSIRPFKATPQEKRKYLKDGVTLIASQHEHDEEPEAFGQRIKYILDNDMDGYYVRKEIPRIQSQLEDFKHDMWAVSQNIRQSQLHKRWPKNPRECLRFGKCPYWGVCTHSEELTDTDVFEKLEFKHPELSEAINEKL